MRLPSLPIVRHRRARSFARPVVREAIPSNGSIWSGPGRGQLSMAGAHPAMSEVSLGHAPWVATEVRSRLATYLISHADGQGFFNGRIVFAQIGRLDEVNKRRGRVAGDHALLCAVERVVQAVDARLAVAHLGGGLLAAIEPHRWRAPHLPETLAGNVASPMTMAGAELELSCATVDVPLRQSQVGTLMEAHAALDRAEQTARLSQDVQASKADVPRRAARRNAATVSDVERALDRREILAHYQPIVDLHSGRIVAAEALARWPGAPSGVACAEDFLSVAAVGGMDARLTDLILDQVCRDLAQARAVAPDTWFTVNLSANEAISADMASRVHAALERHHVPLHSLVLEISERVVPDPVTCRALEELFDSGLRLAMDDFGTAWSSPRQLTALPIELVKLDRSLISDDPGARETLEAAVAMAKGLGLKVLAEGVERAKDLELAEVSGIDFGQGFLWGAADDLGQLLDELAHQGPLPAA